MKKLEKKLNIKGGSLININKTYEGQTIEEMINKIYEGKDTIQAESPPIYCNRNDGVRPEYNIRTDRFDIALKTATEANVKDINRRLKTTEKADESKEKINKTETTENQKIADVQPTD